ncbi:MAG: 4'-phosphopantetheinyl transferase family protein [Bryobacteraceae bacterium]
MTSRANFWIILLQGKPKSAKDWRVHYQHTGPDLEKTARRRRFGMKRFNPAGHSLDLGPNDVHVWCADLDMASADLATFETYLGPDERTRAHCFYFSRDRDRFICAHGLLREILSSHSGQPPASFRFSYGKSGKPEALQSSSRIPNFNHSRSSNMAVFTFARDRAVGIDIEHIEDDQQFFHIATQYYTHSENVILNNLSGGAKITEFFSYWTRLEVYLKATGEGLGHLGNDLELKSPVLFPRRHDRVDAAIGRTGS